MTLPAAEQKLTPDDRADRRAISIELREVLGHAGGIDGMSVEWIFDHFQRHRERH